MFNSLSGEITYKDTEKMFLRTGDVEWELWMSARSASSLPPVGQTARIFTYLYHREDQIRLYGFGSHQERELFLQLIKVEGVGPRLALRIMSGTSVERFVEAVERDDLSTLTQIPGLGQKTAQKIVLKLKGTLPPLQQKREAEYEDIVTALAGMGFDRREARDAVLEALKGLDKEGYAKEDLERELLSLALKTISRKS
jgi:Holliday junction DNA helicase RuvA